MRRGRTSVKLIHRYQSVVVTCSSSSSSSSSGGGGSSSSRDESSSDSCIPLYIYLGNMTD